MEQLEALHNDFTKNSLEIIGEMLDTRTFDDFANNLDDTEESGLKIQKNYRQNVGVSSSSNPNFHFHLKVIAKQSE